MKAFFYGHNGVFILEHHFGEYFVHTQGNPQRICPPPKLGFIVLQMLSKHVRPK